MTDHRQPRRLEIRKVWFSTFGGPPENRAIEGRDDYADVRHAIRPTLELHHCPLCPTRRSLGYSWLTTRPSPPRRANHSSDATYYYHAPEEERNRADLLRVSGAVGALHDVGRAPRQQYLHQRATGRSDCSKLRSAGSVEGICRSLNVFCAAVKLVAAASGRPDTSAS